MHTVCTGTVIGIWVPQRNAVLLVWTVAGQRGLEGTSWPLGPARDCLWQLAADRVKFQVQTWAHEGPNGRGIEGVEFEVTTSKNGDANNSPPQW